MRWDKEREELQIQYRNVLQACMEAEISAEQGRKREEALHTGLFVLCIGLFWSNVGLFVLYIVLWCST